MTSRIELRPGRTIVDLPKSVASMQRDLQLPQDSAQYRAAVLFRAELERALARTGRTVTATGEIRDRAP